MANSRLPVSPAAGVLQSPRGTEIRFIDDLIWKPPGMREAKTNGPKKKCQNQTDDVRRKTACIFIEIIVGSSF